MNAEALDHFFQKYIANQHTEAEHQQFIDWLKTAPIDEVDVIITKYGSYFETFAVEATDEHTDLIEKIEKKLNALESRASLPVSIWLKNKRIISVAAAVILMSSVCLYFWKAPIKQKLALGKPVSYIILPGTNKAVLTLSNGSRILLNNAKNGIITKQNNAIVNKTRNGQLVYTIKKKEQDEFSNSLAFNTITTPQGGQYEVVLPDGSKVWLNAASSLKFPISFNGKSRNVELKGEAYFEVAKNKAMPFRVAVNNTQVEVLGTHFNIMAYADESTTKTTLLEGSVKVTRGNQSKIIIPGQQASVKDNIQLLNVDADQAIEWKNGNFNFAHEDLKTIMRKLARWYDVTIEYQGEITKEGFVGVIPRSGNISEVLNTLELTGLVHFKIQERRIIVMK